MNIVAYILVGTVLCFTFITCEMWLNSRGKSLSGLLLLPILPLLYFISHIQTCRKIRESDVCISCYYSAKVREDERVVCFSCCNTESPRVDKVYYLDSRLHRETILGRKLNRWEHTVADMSKIGCSIYLEEKSGMLGWG